MEKTTSAAFADSKPHYELLDGLRGVAALVVMWYHVFEGFATSPIDQGFNHGYLAVDFFFILSGFVIGYAYDDRWKKTLTTREFFKRRLIRLHPMVIMGVVLGAITYWVQGCERWDGSHVATSMVMLAMLLNLFLIPVAPGAAADVRGNSEMYPLNGPNWSLFFEYIGNILYALFIRRLSTRWLAVLVALAGAGLAGYAIGNGSGYGHLGVGWSLAGTNFPGGMLRLLFAFSAGLLMSRVFKPVHIRGAFWLCSLAVVVLLSMPHVGGAERLWLNGLYDSVCVILIFPLLVWLGASGKATDSGTSRVCKFCGDISYPVYVVHYPFMYLFYAWLWGGEEKIPFSQAWPAALLVFFGSIALTYLILKMYDEPVRRWLARRFLKQKSRS
ncbi:MAG TPA: acyltransferase [Candidatus Bacteroides intestinavium]|uniref:Acyltransferase n=1 Tax=Candidatus Bacteroides intestinavium TaxID=2838469 RepID=A0A9D2HUK0_9BACE|nr:acyltransferase [Candidatus Bacteroides intestinavium]